MRQNVPGKRVALGLALRAMSRHGIRGDIPIVFMDGDTILAPGTLARCLPIFHLRPDVHALTTFERAIVYGHPFMQKWFDLRFAQRHMAMQSHAISDRVLTLTGRMSMIRASQCLDEEFISTIECDALDHWLWGRFRFLSGDDKSTWFVLLKRGAKMLYVPDAVVYTIDRIEKRFVKRAMQNLLRWSGNMLRNGARAIELGPRVVPPFIWWCLIDQRLAMWTCLVGPVAIVGAAAVLDPLLVLALPVWVLFIRGLLASLLWYYHGRIDITFPFLLYFNQLSSSVLKIWILFRLPIQRWANRGDQRSYAGGDRTWIRKLWFADYLTLLWSGIFVVAVFAYSGILGAPLLAYVLDFVRQLV